jgi:AP-3 complex subunit beta
MSGGVADGFRSLVSSWAGSRGQAAPAAVGNAVERATAAVKDTVSAYSVSEEQFFDEDRFSEAEIRSALNNPGLDMKLVAMKRILAGMACGRDVEALFADVVKNVSTTNLELKKMTYIYLIQYAERHKDLALLAMNSFQKDLADRSQFVRAAALKAMASTRGPEVVPLVMLSVQKAVTDTSAYVRKTAAMCLAKVFLTDKGYATELRASADQLLGDHDLLVMEAALLAANLMFVVDPVEDAGVESIAFAHQHFRSLCTCAPQMEPWAQVLLIDVLCRYCRTYFADPAGEEPQSSDFKTALATLTSLMRSTSAAVVTAAVVTYGELTGELCIRPLMRALMCAKETELPHVLPVVDAYAARKPEMFRPHLRCFFLKQCEPTQLKLTKLGILQSQADETNVSLLLTELQTYVCWRGDDAVSQSVVRCVAGIALAHPKVADSCLHGLVRLLDVGCAAVAEEAVIAVRLLLQQEREDSREIVAHLAHLLDELKSPAARASVIWLLGQYQHDIPFVAPDALRRLVQSFATESREVKLQVLPLAVKVWAFHAANATKDAGGAATAGQDLKVMPPEISAQIVERLEAITEHVFQLCEGEMDWDLRDLARTYKVVYSSCKGASASDGATVEAEVVAALRTGSLGPAHVDATEIANGSLVGQPRYVLGSLAQALGEPFPTYRELPGWAATDSSDEVRIPVARYEPAKEVRSLGSDMKAEGVNFASRVQTKAANIEFDETLEDLDLFYSTDTAPKTTPASLGLTAPSPAAPAGAGAQPAAMIDISKLMAPQGNAVLGEDDESEDDDDWGDMKK